MSSAVLISVSEYLSTSYSPDREYIDGEVRERNLGEYDHSRMQGRLHFYLMAREKLWGVKALVEQRVQVKPTRFRVPDVIVIAGPRPARIVVRPPLLCIEVLSPEDSMKDMRERVDDYLALGVPDVWVINPIQWRAFHYTPEGMREVKDGILRTANPEISVPMAALQDD